MKPIHPRYSSNPKQKAIDIGRIDSTVADEYRIGALDSRKREESLAKINLLLDIRNVIMGGKYIHCLKDLSPKT